ncbi:MAG: carboxypeptidase regulatory-like domain-containing protein [Euryarchaeota archaeon]|nr:carboxypeptidase regulatory-like domain-containing protein [Euryarchaeota archaeon]
MKTNLKEIISLILVVILVGTLLPIQTIPLHATIVQDTSKTGNERQYWALIVGIGTYADNPEQNRPDMILEANDFKNLLLQSSWWSEDHIKILTAENATVSNILAGFRWLSKMASADDVVVVYLSTHGMYHSFDIPPKDETDSLDEFLISYWGFAYNLSFINDDTINVLLNKIKSDNVCLIVDSCYAGGFNDHWKLLKSATEQSRVILIGSCEDEEAVSGGFAPFLIDGLRGYADTNKDGVITAEEAFNYSQPRSSSWQTPTMYDGYPGELPLTTDTIHQAASSAPSSYSQKITPIPPLNTIGVSAETAVLCGYVNGTGQPIHNALVTVSGRINYQQTYTNSTTTDPAGFYFMHVPAMRIRMTVSAQGYCDASTNQFQVLENTTYWRNFTLVPHPSETAILRGYISSAHNGTPLVANVSLRWRDNLQQTYRNTTVSDVNGFYQMDVAPGQISLDISKEGYFPEAPIEFNITDAQTIWTNVSLYPLPPETSAVCGYLTDNSTGAPLINVRVDVTWFNVSINHEYTREARTNASGFFSIPIAPGELYIDLREDGFNYYDPYRHDAVDGKPLWMNLSIQPASISVDIAKPLRAFYLHDQRIMPWSSTRIIGPITIEATSGDFFYGPENWQVQKVEFYIDNTLKATVTTEPYSWNWTTRTLGKHSIKVVAYGLNNETASKEIQVTKFL